MYKDMKVELGEEEKKEVMKELAEYLEEVRGKCAVEAVGGLYFRYDLREGEAFVETEEEDIVVGPAVMKEMYWGPMKRVVKRDLGPWKSEKEFAETYLVGLFEGLKHELLIMTGKRKYFLKTSNGLTRT